MQSNHVLSKHLSKRTSSQKTVSLKFKLYLGKPSNSRQNCLQRTGLTAQTNLLGIYWGQLTIEYVYSTAGTTWLRESDAPEEFSGQLYTGLSCPNNKDGMGKQQTFGILSPAESDGLCDYKHHRHRLSLGRETSPVKKNGSGLLYPNNEDDRGKQQPHASKTEFGIQSPEESDGLCDCKHHRHGLWDVRQAQCK